MWDVSAPIVVVSAAMSVPSGFYRPLKAAFEERRWACDLVPTRGFDRGQPTASRREDWSYGTEAQTIADHVAAARAAEPDRPVVLLGHSLGCQLGVLHQLHHDPADGFVAVGASVPHFRSYPYGGLGVLFMGVSVPVVTRAFGYLPKPFFGAPGARTLMREWAGFVRSGKAPFDVPHPVPSPTLVVKLQGDAYAVSEATDDFVDQFLDPAVTRRWTYTTGDVPDGGTTDHIQWVRTPDVVVDRIVDWWATQPTRP